MRKEKKPWWRKALLCRLGLHAWRPFGWTVDRRLDICKRDGCSRRRWRTDRKGPTDQEAAPGRWI